MNATLAKLISALVVLLAVCPSANALVQIGFMPTPMGGMAKVKFYPKHKAYWKKTQSIELLGEHAVEKILELSDSQVKKIRKSISTIKSTEKKLADLDTNKSMLGRDAFLEKRRILTKNGIESEAKANECLLDHQKETLNNLIIRKSAINFGILKSLSQNRFKDGFDLSVDEFQKVVRNTRKVQPFTDKWIATAKKEYLESVKRSLRPETFQRIIKHYNEQYLLQTINVGLVMTQLETLAESKPVSVKGFEIFGISNTYTCDGLAVLRPVPLNTNQTNGVSDVQIMGSIHEFFSVSEWSEFGKSVVLSASQLEILDRFVQGNIKLNKEHVKSLNQDHAANSNYRIQQIKDQFQERLEFHASESLAEFKKSLLEPQQRALEHMMGQIAISRIGLINVLCNDSLDNWTKITDQEKNSLRNSASKLNSRLKSIARKCQKEFFDGLSKSLDETKRNQLEKAFNWNNKNYPPVAPEIILLEFTSIQ